MAAMLRGLLPIFLLCSTVARAEILKAEIDGAIGPITSEFISDSIREAQQTKASLLLLRLATPGGLGISMQEIIEEILNSAVPIVCYVAPRGSQAASAGFLILLASDVAAMAPGTNTGAAHPVLPFGMENKVVVEKVKNNILANLRSIMENRERNYELAREGVENSKSYTASEALEGRLIDLIADNESDLLLQLEGREVKRFDGEKVRLKIAGQTIRILEPTLRQRFLSAIANPNFALILGLIGLLGLYLEFQAPGTVFPGVIGGISLLLALLGFSVLPINYVGVLLILLGLGLFLAEVTVQGFGVLGIGGTVSLALGLVFLVDSPYPELRISPSLAFAVVLPFALVFFFFLWLLVKNRQTQVVTGRKGLAGALGTARTPLDRHGGRVFVQGELWNALAREPIDSGTPVRVIRNENLTLLVEPCSNFPEDWEE